MRLLGRTSSINVRKVMWTAAEIGIRYEHEPEWGTTAAPTQDDGFVRLNPNGLIPVWIDDAGALWESNTICRYLANKHGREDLLPASAFERAQVEKWMDWGAGDLNAAWRYPFMWLVRQDARFDDGAQVQRGTAAWNTMMQTLDAHLAAARPFAAGPYFTLADIILGLSAHRWLHTPIERPRLSNIERYVQELVSRPACADLATAALP
ncbi:MAG: glutathione S-transferase N-terminal domain-containing protein [Devosia sp.]